MANFSLLKVKTAVEKNNPFYDEADHMTSGNFMEFGIAKKIWLPKGNWKLTWKTKSNMQPMPQPTFGRVKFSNRLFWVPCRTIYKGFNDYVVDNIHVSANDTYSKILSLPYTAVNEIVAAVDNYSENGTPSVYDYSYQQNNVLKQRCFTNRSKRLYKLVCQLWGKVPLNPNIDREVCMMPLLAAAKVYLDYYYNVAYVNDSQYLNVKKILERDNGNLFYDAQDVNDLLTFIELTFYGTSYFVSAWDNPNHPNISNQEGTYVLPDPNGKYATVTTNSNIFNLEPNVNNLDGKDPAIEATGTSVGGVTSDQRGIGVITQTTINLLKGLSSYLKRHQLAGGYTISRYLARFGVKLQDEQLNRCTELGVNKWSMEVDPIFSTSDTAAAGGENLGSYAGNGYSESNPYTFTIETNEYGLLIAISTIQPKEIYSDGMDPQAFMMTNLDLWTPEFDNIGVEPIRACELVTSNEESDGANQDGMFSQIFGFLPRYAKWKQLRSECTGDILIGRIADQEQRYVFLRNIDKTGQPSSYVHSKDFTKGSDATQYNRIFYGNTDKLKKDYFRLLHSFTLEGFSGMKPMYDVYEWEHEGGKDIEMKNGGALTN